MNLRHALLLALTFTASHTLTGQTRQSALVGAKNLVITTNKGTTYYYLVTSLQSPVMHLEDGTVVIGTDKFQRQDIKAMRFRSLKRAVLNEDSTTFDKTMALDHSLLALRRHLNTGKWNSLVLPFDLTGRQLLDVFGDETQLATPRAISEDGQTTVEFATMDLQTDDVVLRANFHYLVKPTREPDVEEGKRLTNFGSSQLYGPIYFIPNVSMKANQAPRFQTLQNEDGSTKVRLRGTYLRLDDSVVNGKIIKNRRAAPGAYLLDDGLMTQHTDSAIVSAFQSWIEDISENAQPLHFYVDGINEDITSGIADFTMQNSQFRMYNSELEDAIFDLSGRRMEKRSLPAGIYVRGGHKFIVK
ncbi:MAG: hypothetical protein J5545_03395 [Bacteroidaceae bacterium]|nr:hypothetical protein [Bacteroidaceae bacterium]